MPDGRTMTADRLLAMLKDSMASAHMDPDLLDQAFWAHVRRVDFPLTHYDLETWEDCARDGEKVARATSRFENLVAHLDESFPGNRVSLDMQNGQIRIRVLVPDLGTRIEASFQGVVEPARLGLAVAHVFVDVDRMAAALRARLSAVAGLGAQIPPYEAWPIEEVTPGRFGAVSHDFGLLCATANSPEGAARHAAMNHKGDYGILLCRERYVRAFSERALDRPAPADDVGETSPNP